MPDAAIAAGHVDYILKLKGLVTFLIHIVREVLDQVQH